MADLPRSHLRLADLATRKPTPFEIVPDAAARATIAAMLNIPSVRKLRLQGQIAPVGPTDWHLTADLGATVVQDCVITLDPVTTRIDEAVDLTYVADFPEIDAAEIEMTGDDTVEPLPASVDLTQIMIEALSLALPPFPKAAGAEMGAVTHTEPGKTAMTDDDAKPFAGLQSLRDSLAGDADDKG